jgi:superfamily II DNA or RNA helicase
VSLDPLFRAMKAETPTRAWDGGIRLFRADVVTLLERDDEEIRVNVRVGGRSMPHEVHLWPEDEEWSCDCGHEDGCAHATAAILAIRQGDVRGEAPRDLRAGRMRYRLEPGEGGLVVHREVLRGQAIEPVKGRLQGIQGLAVTTADQVADQVLRMGSANIPVVGWHRLVRAWAEAESPLHWRGQPVRASAELITPVAIVRDEGPGFKLSLHRNARIDESLPGGLVRCGDTLHAAGNGSLASHDRHALAQGVTYSPDQVAELVGAVLPRLRQQITVRVKTERLPEGEAQKPSLQLQLQPTGKQVRIRLDLVYGDPPTARVENGRLVMIGQTVPLRDLAVERRLARQAEDMKLPIGRPLIWDEASTLEFARTQLPGFQGRVVGETRRWSVRREAAHVELRGDRLHSDADLGRLTQAWVDGEHLVPLTDGSGYAPLPVDFMEAHGHLIADLVAARQSDGSTPAHALPALAELAAALDTPVPARLDGLRPLLEDYEGLPEVPLPSTLQATLRPYQETGYRWLSFLMKAGLGGILADDMGLGKTLQALCAVSSAGGRALVVAPTSVLGNWKAEAERFLPGIRVCRFHGPRRELDTSADLVVTSYALLRLDPLLREQDWTTVVLDEAQAIKNPESQTAQAAFELSATHRFSLTGTPIENRLDELWSQLHFVMPGFLGGRKGFQERYARAVERGDRAASRALRARIRPFVLRRLKSQVAKDLPPRTDVVLHCPMGPQQRKVYEAVHGAARGEVAQLLGDGKALAVLELLLRLRQAACHPRLLPGDRPDESGKLKVLLESLDEVVGSGSRALVFSQWTGFLDLISEALKANDIDHLRLDGSTRDRDGMVARFQAEGGPPVFLISLRAGGTGLNLTAADYVFHTDPWWNPAVEDQAVDRAHRIGQRKPVVSVKLIAEDSVEEGIVKLQQRKRALAEAAIGTEAQFVKGLDKSDLLALFA